MASPQTANTAVLWFFSPDFIISAQAVPSGKGSLLCSSTIMNLRIGIMNKIPKIPPQADKRKILKIDGESPSKISAGIVKITPAASPSPTVAIVWTRLFSRTVEFLKKIFKTAIDMMAAGIDADTVVPIFKAK